MSIDIRIDVEFAGLIPKLSGEVYSGLEENILRNGCLDTIKTWDGVIVDGHNRYRICSEHGIAYQTHGLEFTDREAAKNWMILNQLDRRDLTPEQRSYLRGKLYTAKKGEVGFQDGNQHASKHGVILTPCLPDTDNPAGRTREQVAEAARVSPSTIQRDQTYAGAVDEIAAKTDEGTKQKILTRELHIPKQDVQAIAELPAEEVQGLIARGEEEILKAAKRIRQEKAEANKISREQEKAAIAADIASGRMSFPVGRYQTIVIDPPWEMEKIERDLMPNQVGFDYPTMTEDELREFPLPGMAADDCHLYLWTTHKHLPIARPSGPYPLSLSPHAI